MFKIPKQEYTPEFKELAVKRVTGGQGIAAVAKDLGLVEQTLRNWVKAAKAGKLNPPGAKAVTPEQMELSRLRAENARLRLECEILKNRLRARTSHMHRNRQLYTGAAHGQWPPAFWRLSSPSKNLAQGKLRTQLWWHNP